MWPDVEPSGFILNSAQRSGIQIRENLKAVPTLTLVINPNYIKNSVITAQ